MIKSFLILSSQFFEGGLAQLARASALQAEGQRFESVILHELLTSTSTLTYWDKKREEQVCIPLPSKDGETQEVNKGERWMPRLSEAKKDVISCEKLR